MRIAAVLSHFPSLTETYVLNQICGLIDRGHDVEIFAYGPGPSEAIHPEVERYGLLECTTYFNVPENRIDRASRFLRMLPGTYRRAPKTISESMNFMKYGKEALSLRLFFGALAFAGRRPFDIIHSYHGPNALKDTYLRDMGAFQGKHVASFHGMDLSRHIEKYGRNVYRRLIDRGDLFLVVSEGMSRRLQDLGFPPEKVRVQRTGINIDFFSFEPPQIPAEGPVRIISVGRLVEKKGFEYGLRAIAILHRRGLNVRYEIIGAGELAPRLKKICLDLQIVPLVIFRGERHHEEVRSLMKQSHILIAPSVTASDGNREGIPNALKEAMACGLPVVSTRHGEIPELVEDHINGSLVPECDDKALAEKIRNIIEAPEVATEMAFKARKKIEMEYDMNKLNVKLEVLYQSVLTVVNA